MRIFYEDVGGEMRQLSDEARKAVRDLRLWHWQRVLSARRRQHDGRASKHTRVDAEREASDHLKAVQALNSLFPAGDTAERDHANRLLARKLT